jgi:hypothetical protein
MTVGIPSDLNQAQHEAIEKVRGYVAEDHDTMGQVKRALWGRLRIDQIKDGETVRTWIIGNDGSITWTS